MLQCDKPENYHPEHWNKADTEHHMIPFVQNPYRLPMGVCEPREVSGANGDTSILELDACGGCTTPWMY